MSLPADASTPMVLGDRAREVLACPSCSNRPITITGAHLTCPQCGWEQDARGRTISALDAPTVASFDEKHQVLAEHNHHPVTWKLAYQRQCELIVSTLRPGRVVLDLGCGPEAPYEKPPGAYIVGVDASLPSVTAHPDLDLGLHTTAARVPLGDQTVDVVLANYVFHHMIGDTVAESWSNVESAFAEIARVAKPGSEVLVLEICPWAPVWAAERVGWRLAHRALGPLVDFLFWPVPAYRTLGARTFPGARFEERRFSVPWSATFPPMIGLPWLKIPWGLYPFHVCLFRWQLSPRPSS